MNTKINSCIVAALFGVVFTLQVYGQGTAFTYQGRLSDNGSPANGTYNFQFAIFDSPIGGNQIGPTLPNIFAVTSNGLFTVTLNFGANIFTGPSRWLEIGARTNGSVASFTVLTPRQALLPTPYAILAGTISGVVNSSALSGVYSDALTMTNAANSFRGAFTGNGAGLTNLNAASIGGQTPSNFWQTAGNLNTSAGTQFLGTRDNQPLELRVNNSRVARFAAGANVTLGISANFITNGVVGSTIAGGRFNTNNAGESTIGGGRNNRIDPSSDLSSIGGGLLNTVEAGADQSVIGGGNSSTIELGARESFIGGGFANTMGSGGIVAFIGAGTRNTNSGFASFIGGGQRNVVETGSGNSVIGGGVDNTVNLNAQYATIPGGRSNSATNYAFAAGRRAKANHQGAFVWADSTDADFASSSGNQFLIRASGGVGVGTSDPEAFLHVTSAGFAAPQLRLEQTVNNDFARLRFTSTTKPFWDLAVGGSDNVMNFYSSGYGNVMTLTTNASLELFNHNVRSILVQASETSGAGGQILMYNGAGTNNTIEIDAQFGSAGGGYIGLRNSSGERIIELDTTDGTVKGRVIEITGGADFSENFDISGSAHEPGMIVSIDSENPGRLVLSSSACDKKVAGIISGAGGVRPGMLMGQRGSLADGKHPVALSGRVYCFVDADANGPVGPGDMLTTSHTIGHAMKVSDPALATGAIIGKAMTSLAQGRGLVLVLVNLQ